MQVDFSVELGKDDHCLEIPWKSPDGSQYYVDIKSRPEKLLEIAEAHENRELADFLMALNSPHSIIETAKCDTWLSNEIDPEEEIFGAAWKFGAYIDVVFSNVERRSSFSEHEEFVKSLRALLNKAPEFAAEAEFVVRRCYFHSADMANASGPESSENGFCITIYVIGFGDSEVDAQKHWAIALKVVQNAILQLMAQLRRQ
jgi:hypothetical protein